MKQVIQRFTLVGLLALLAGTLFAAAQQAPPAPGHLAPPPPPPGQHGPPNPVIGMAGPALHELGLSREQREQIHVLVRNALEDEFGQLLEAFGEARRALELAIWSSSSSEQDLALASQTVAERASQLEFARHQLAREILDLLTEDQRAAFQQALAEAPSHPGPPRAPRASRGPRGGPPSR
ncbi:MAG: hypothetical protein JSV80_08810 [Acidobacteriota bacterium]|nr:MAG: hypothetical protein JSV80_08810 [Acidobacteriota bacterium]